MKNLEASFKEEHRNYDDLEAGIRLPCSDTSKAMSRIFAIIAFLSSSSFIYGQQSPDKPIDDSPKDDPTTATKIVKEKENIDQTKLAEIKKIFQKSDETLLKDSSSLLKPGQISYLSLDNKPQTNKQKPDYSVNLFVDTIKLKGSSPFINSTFTVTREKGSNSISGEVDFVPNGVDRYTQGRIMFTHTDGTKIGDFTFGAGFGGITYAENLETRARVTAISNFESKEFKGGRTVFAAGLYERNIYTSNKDAFFSMEAGVDVLTGQTVTFSASYLRDSWRDGSLKLNFTKTRGNNSYSLFFTVGQQAFSTGLNFNFK